VGTAAIDEWVALPTDELARWRWTLAGLLEAMREELPAAATDQMAPWLSRLETLMDVLAAAEEGATLDEWYPADDA
jgi:hypothetical protein